MTLDELRNDGDLKARLGKLFSSKDFQAVVDVVKQTKLTPRAKFSASPGMSPETAVAWHYSAMVGAQELLDFILGLPNQLPLQQKPSSDPSDKDGFDEQNAPYNLRRP